MDSTVQRDIMRLTVRGAWEPLLHDNADMIDFFKEANRPDLIHIINAFESAFMWLTEQLDADKEKA
ncbi:MAG: hypothetical protein IJB25_00690 [Clostridia bacterium]|nr:hypothetical protein [Clostridia bacterium]